MHDSVQCEVGLFPLDLGRQRTTVIGGDIHDDMDTTDEIRSAPSDFSDCCSEVAKSESATGSEEYDSLLEGVFQHTQMLRSLGLEQACGEADGLIENSQLDLKAPVKMVTGSGFIRASPEAVLEILRNVEQRPTWDDLCDFGNVVRRLGAAADMVYLSYQGKLGVCARDLCLLRGWRREADGSLVLVSHSVESDDVPRVAGKVRAHLHNCAYICAPAAGGCRLTYVIKLDMKGYIPLFFTNLIQSQHTFVIASLRRTLEQDCPPIDGSG